MKKRTRRVWHSNGWCQQFQFDYPNLANLRSVLHDKKTELLIICAGASSICLQSSCDKNDYTNPVFRDSPKALCWNLQIFYVDNSCLVNVQCNHQNSWEFLCFKFKGNGFTQVLKRFFRENEEKLGYGKFFSRVHLFPEKSLEEHT